MKLRPGGIDTSGLSRRAAYFVGVHAVRVDVPDLGPYRAAWVANGVPEADFERVAVFQQRWGGLLLPPAPEYDGGPRFLNAFAPQPCPDGGWWFEAGQQRSAVPYAFTIGPDGEFGIEAVTFVAIHASVEGWIEALALAHYAAIEATQVTKLVGDAVDTLDIDGFEPVAEVRGLADTWWRGGGSLVAVHTAEAICLEAPQVRTARFYTGLRDFDISGPGRTGSRGAAT